MKYALVTGGSRGIGRAICLKLAEMGYHILINYQSNNTEAEATLQQIREQGSDGELMKFDVTDAAATHAALNGWMEQHPDTYIEVLVNNAGIRRDNLMLWMVQAIDCLDIADRISPRSQQVYKEIRAFFPVFREDTPKYKEIESMMVYLKKGRFQEK